jgi:hypothetical protein
MTMQEFTHSVCNINKSGNNPIHQSLQTCHLGFAILLILEYLLRFCSYGFPNLQTHGGHASSDPLYHYPAEWGKRQECQFEMLFGKWYADDGNSQQNAKKYVAEEDPDAAKDQPDEIHEGGQAARLMLHGLNLPSKGP